MYRFFPGDQVPFVYKVIDKKVSLEPTFKTLFPEEYQLMLNNPRLNLYLFLNTKTQPLFDLLRSEYDSKLNLYLGSPFLFYEKTLEYYVKSGINKRLDYWLTEKKLLYPKITEPLTIYPIVDDIVYLVKSEAKEDAKIYSMYYCGNSPNNWEQASEQGKAGDYNKCYDLLQYQIQNVKQLKRMEYAINIFIMDKKAVDRELKQLLEKNKADEASLKSVNYEIEALKKHSQELQRKIETAKKEYEAEKLKILNFGQG